MEEVIRKRLAYLKQKILESLSRKEYNYYLREFNQLYLDWIDFKGKK